MTTDELALRIAKAFYDAAFEGYYNRSWDNLPSAQKYRFLRAAYQVLDLISDQELRGHHA